MHKLRIIIIIRNNYILVPAQLYSVLLDFCHVAHRFPRRSPLNYG